MPARLLVEVIGGCPHLFEPALRRDICNQSVVQRRFARDIYVNQKFNRLTAAFISNHTDTCIVLWAIVEVSAGERSVGSHCLNTRGGQTRPTRLVLIVETTVDVAAGKLLLSFPQSIQLDPAHCRPKFTFGMYASWPVSPRTALARVVGGGQWTLEKTTEE